MIEQGEKMRRTATSQTTGGKKPIDVGTVICIKMSRVDRGKLDPPSVPGVVCEMTNLPHCLQRWSAKRLSTSGTVLN